MEQQAIDLSLAVYRITKLYPEGEVLIGQLRQTANNIVREISLAHSNQAKKQIRTLINLLKIAEKQSWVCEMNYVILIKAYHQLLTSLIQKKRLTKERFKPLIKLQKKETPLLSRQLQIKDFIKDKDRVTLKDICQFLPQTNPRTLRKDMQVLVNKKLLIQQGRGRSSFYQVIGHNKAQ